MEIRSVQAKDREAVLAFTRNTFSYGDYVAQAWDDWLADTRGAFLAATWAGQPVAIVKIDWTAPDQVWMGGLRVHPDYRGRGVATALFYRALEWSAERGGRVVRLATADDNVTVHHMVSAVGLQMVHISPYYVADCLAEGEEPQPLPPAMQSESWAAIKRWGGLARGHGLYDSGWAWQPLTPERLAGHLQAGQVFGFGTGQGLGALAIVERISNGGDGLFVGFLDGVGEATAYMLRALRVLAGHCNPPKVEITPRDEPELLVHLEAAGYRRGVGPAYWVYEGSLEAWRR